MFYTRRPPFNSLFLGLELCCAMLCIIEVLLRFWTRVSYKDLLAHSWFWISGISVLPILLYVVSINAGVHCCPSVLAHQFSTCQSFRFPEKASKFLKSLQYACCSSAACCLPLPTHVGECMHVSRSVACFTRPSCCRHALFGLWSCAVRAAVLQTVTQSARLLYMLLFFATLAMLINASVLYYLERGTYSQAAQVSFVLQELCCLRQIAILQSMISLFAIMLCVYSTHTDKITCNRMVGYKYVSADMGEVPGL